MTKRVDEIPILIRPLYLALSWLIATIIYSGAALVHLTCRIEYIGIERLTATTPNIVCIWHETLFPYFAVFKHLEGDVIWMNHPSWYMKPIHYLLHFFGVKKLALGSSGNSGKEALQIVINHLKEGYSTAVATDGPSGPLKRVKDGVLIMSRDSGLPIFPVRINTSHEIRLPSWDRKRIPMPFSKLVLYVDEAIFVNGNNFEQARQELTDALNKSY